MKVENVGVLGAGTMGSGIVQVFAQHGYLVRVVEVEQRFLDAGMARLEKGLGRLVKKEVLTGTEADEVLARVAGSTSIADLFECDLVVEAIIEDVDAKREVFAELDAGCPRHTILASNTSSISVTKIAAATDRPDRVIGMHFFNPVPVMKLVEVIRGESTSDETHEQVMGLAEGLGKTPVTVMDVPGFISNRVLMPMINEAIFCLQEGAATADDIDTVMKLGMNHPMGPLVLADFIGLDVCLAILEVLHRGYGEAKYRPCPLLRRKVDAGHLGRKTGRGFYEY